MLPLTDHNLNYFLQRSAFGYHWHGHTLPERQNSRLSDGCHIHLAWSNGFVNFNEDVMRSYIIFFYLFLAESVGFGGIAGLFLGSSLLSAVEFLYYLLLGFYENIWIPNKTSNSPTKIKRNLDVTHSITPNTSPTTIIIYPKDFVQLKIRN